MRRGCIAVGDISCDGCGRAIKHPERRLWPREFLSGWLGLMLTGHYI